MSRSWPTPCSVGSAIRVLCSLPNSRSGRALRGRGGRQSPGTGSCRRASKSPVLFSLTMARNQVRLLVRPSGGLSRENQRPLLVDVLEQACGAWVVVRTESWSEKA